MGLQVNEGSALTAGALIAKLELDDPTKVKRAENFTGKADVSGWTTCLPPKQLSGSEVLFAVHARHTALQCYLAGQLPNLGPPQVYCDRVDHKFTNALNAAKMIMAGEQAIAAWRVSIVAWSLLEAWVACPPSSYVGVYCQSYLSIGL